MTHKCPHCHSPLSRDYCTDCGWEESYQLVVGEARPILNLGRDIEISKRRSQLRLVAGGKTA